MKIAVYTIAKNEEKHIGQWEETTADADVRLIGDTGSIDHTRKELRYFYIPFTLVHVEPFRFDLARNAVLAMLPADIDICISLDLDETLVPGWRDILEAKWKDHNVAQVSYASEGVAPFAHNSRVHSRAGWLWRDPCHEGLYPFGITVKPLVLPEFVITQKQDKTKPRTQYLGLLKMGLDEEPWNTRRIFYYARELLVYRHFDKAIGWFKKYLEFQAAAGQEHEEVEQARAYLYLAEGALREQQTGIKEPHLL